jgi:hypothetical protein
MEVRDTFSHALPNTTSLQLDTWSIDDAHAQITLLISSTQAAPRCPGCDVPARRVQSLYTRTLADLPWSGYGMTWQLRVLKLFCHNRKCPCRIFTERLPGIVAPWARRTVWLMARLLAVGLVLGEAAGARLSQSFGLTVSRNTLLRVIRRAPAAIHMGGGPRRLPAGATVACPATSKSGRPIGRAGPWMRWRTRSGSVGAPCTGTLQSPTFPERQPRHGRDRSLLDPYKATLLAGWNRGCRNGSHLFRTIRRHGFRGQYGIVARYVRRMRQAQGLAPRQWRSARPLPAVTEVSRPQGAAAAAGAF